MATFIWPDYIAPNSIDWWLETPTKSGGQSILGSERIVASPAARWRASMTFRIWGTQGDPNRTLFWRAFAAAMSGRAGSVLIGPFDRLSPAQLSSAARAVRSPFADLATFSDGAQFAQPGTIGAVAASAALQGARQLTVTYAYAGAPMAGQYFGVGGALYLISACADNGGGNFTVSFAPSLRAAASLGDALDFETPRCAMRLLADDTARAKITIGGVADVTLDLVEIL